MKALILSGGSGTRFRPFTYSGAKQLLPAANRPILFHIIDKLARTEIKDIGIIVGDNHCEIELAVGDGKAWNVAITYIYQPQPLGLAHAVKTAADFLQDAPFIMILGDNLFRMELTDVIRDYYKKPVNSLILLHISEDPSRYGVAVINRERVVHLVEKPAVPPSNLIITGIYIFDHTIMDAIDHTIPSARGELEITDAIQKQIELGGVVGYALTEGWWKDTGSIDDFLEANRLIMDDIKTDSDSVCSTGREPKMNDSTKQGIVLAGEDVLISDSHLSGPVVLGSHVSITGCHLGPYTVIGDNCVLAGCDIDNSVIMEGARITNLKGRISASLIGKHTVIEKQDSEQIQAPDREYSIYLCIGDDSKIIF
ncbi:MAG: glucose-1-phosphate thymidylyltransferase [Clostridiaceae bacterium]|jgi:glucose-1-phosphate thymidylyltransferase|nr:glucose-1-phosphate thymidylyltransferase [Clostridiaceae bacterium]